MIATVKKLLPRWLKAPVRQAIKAVKYRWRRYRIAAPVARGDPLKIIVGAAETWQKGWYSTNEDWLDITKAEDWRAVFEGKRIITHVLAEHVFEHLTHDECRIALAHIGGHMKKGGRIRIAVPDGYHPDSDYLRHVGIRRHRRRRGRPQAVVECRYTGRVVDRGGIPAPPYRGV